MLIETEKLSKTYTSGFLCRTRVHALADGNIRVDRGETVGIFGKSGSGKTTLASLIAGAFPPTKGRIFWKGQPVAYPFRGAVRRSIQMVYQHPEEAFDPCWTLGKSLMEPYRIHGIPFRKEEFEAHLARVGLYEEHLARKPHTLSGGELERAALARIMILEPELIILDEPTSMLDSISQAQTLKILRDYQKKHGTAYLFITHDPEVMRFMCGRCYFMEQGAIIKEVTFSHEEKESHGIC